MMTRAKRMCRLVMGAYKAAEPKCRDRVSDQSLALPVSWLRRSERTRVSIGVPKSMTVLQVILTTVIALTAGCGGKRSKTTDTDSREFVDLTERQSFLERYVTFRRSYEELEFDISFVDGGEGRVPGPSEWDIRLLARIPADEIDEWISGLAATESVDASWVSSIPNAPPVLDGFQWYEDGSRVVGFNPSSLTLIYRSQAN